MRCAAIAGHDGYRIWEDGVVETCWGHGVMTESWRPLAVRVNDNGYAYVMFRGRKVRRVHQLVLEAFVGPRPAGMQTRHLDGNRLNNALSNLAWGTPAENTCDRVTHDTFGKKLSVADIPEIRRLLGLGVRRREIASQFDISPVTVGKIERGDRWQHVV